MLHSGNFENFDKFQQTENNLEVDYCSRCKMKEADFYCETCDPFFYFCSTCDGYVHSMNIKRAHQREIINKNTGVGLNNPQENRSYASNVTQYKTNSNSDLYYYTNSNQNLYQSNQNLCQSNQNLTTFKESYINDIKRLFEREREELATKNLALEKQIDSVKSKLNDKIVNLQNQLQDTQKKNNLDLKIIQEEFNIEMRKVITDKDNEIRVLTNKNRELDKSNQELLSKVNDQQNEIFQLKSKFSNSMNSADFEIKQRDNELAEMKAYYEKRISNLTENLSEDKNKTISNYERNIEKLNAGYKESKEKFIGLLRQRDNDINELLGKMKLEENKFHTTVDQLKLEIAKLKEDNSLLNQANKELQYEIRSNQESIEKSKKETKFYMKEAKKLEEEYKTTLKQSEEAKIKLEKLHTITHGKFTKKK